MLPYYILNSESFRAMSPKAVRIYIEILRRYNGQNNGEISLSCREAGKVALCSAETAGKCLKELDTHGFIKPTRTGFFTVRLATTYRITTERWGHHLPTHEWKLWVAPPKVAKKKPMPNLRDSTPHLINSAPSLTMVVSK